MKLLRRFALCAAIMAAFVVTQWPDVVQARDVIAMRGHPPGSIVISTSQRMLYYVLPDGRAIRYPVGVGKAGMAWHGQARIAQKDLRPAWAREPGRTETIPGGSPRNPMGAAAMGLDRGNYAIHGTNDPNSIGGYVSHGCIRMHNEDVMDLYYRARVGTQVSVVQ